jgi:ADP-heptose:LPS heptosyltransferase
MKNILIINFRRIGDVYTTGHLLNSLASSNDNAVSLLVFKESARAAKNLKGLKKLHIIDRHEIITLKSNKLFSDGFALEHLFNQIQEIKKQKWDEIINFSNDIVGAYICSYLKNSTNKVIGVHFDEFKSVIANSDWELLFNDILPIVKYTPLHFIDCYHKMLNISQVLSGQKIITNKKHNASAFTNMSSIRTNLANGENLVKVVGIQLKTSNVTKDLPEEMILELISFMRETKHLVPVILIAPTDEERSYAQDVIGKFKNDIAVVEADLEAVASVLMNIDILITPDTAIKHIADLTETPVLEISLGHAPFLKQGTYSEGSLILSDIITERNFSKNNQSENLKTNIKALDIISSLLYFFGKSKSIRPRLSKDVTLYSCTFDQLGARYAVVAGSIDAQVEIHRLMSRHLIHINYDNNESKELFSSIIDFGTSAITTWCKNEKHNLTIVMKDLLGTLRSLIQIQENRKSSKNFINNLGKLISHSDQETFLQIPVLMFKTKIEKINSKSSEENAREIESLLYHLKSDVQKALQIINHLEDRIAIQRKDDFINRTSEMTNN